MPKQQRTSEKELAVSLRKFLSETLDQADKNLNDDSPEGALARGKVFQLAGYYLEAADSYADALAQDEGMDEAAARMVVVQLKARHPEKALASAMALAGRNPGFELKEFSSNQYANAMTLLGDALAQNERLTDAIEAYKIASSASKRDSFASGRLAQLYLATGQPKQAVEQAKAIQANTRFRSLSRVLNLGLRSASLLPVFQPGSFESIRAVTDHGRPLLIDGTPRIASVVHGNDQWCAAKSELGLE